MGDGDAVPRRHRRDCTPERNEFILLSDMLGMTTAIDDVNNEGPGWDDAVLGRGPIPLPRASPGARRLDLVRPRAGARDADGRPRTGAQPRTVSPSLARRLTCGRPTTPGSTTPRTRSKPAAIFVRFWRQTLAAGTGFAPSARAATRCQLTERAADCCAPSAAMPCAQRTFTSRSAPRLPSAHDARLHRRRTPTSTLTRHSPSRHELICRPELHDDSAAQQRWLMTEPFETIEFDFTLVPLAWRPGTSGTAVPTGHGHAGAQS